MALSRTTYKIHSITMEDINRVLNQISNRLDSIQGVSGSSSIYGDTTVEGDILVSGDIEVYASDSSTTVIHKME